MRNQVRIFIVIFISVFFTVLQSGCTHDEWKDLFDGKTTEGWEVPGKSAIWEVENGALMTEKAGLGLFYRGDVSGHNFKNFILKMMMDCLKIGLTK